MKQWIIFVLFFMSYRAASGDPWRASSEIYQNRLPRSFSPWHYDLFIRPNIYGVNPPFQFLGKVKIYFTCNVVSQILTLTSSELTIDKARIKFTSSQPDGTTPKLKSLVYDVNKQFVYLETDEMFKKGFNYTVSIEYSGIMIENSFGLYAARYYDENNKIRYLAATQLEPIGFRKLSPGFDEVDMKATFDVILARREHLTSLSNTQLINIHMGPEGWIHDVFGRSPVMSPYLLCIVVGDLKYLEAVVEEGRQLKVRAYTTPALLKYLDHPNKYYIYPLQKWLEQETQIPYPLQKIDHVALFTFGGAMENWGLITYAEDILPVSNTTSPADSLLRCSFVIAHELTHMWYGNLVTCEWWTHLWLQEAMASYYNSYPLQALGWQGSELQQIMWVMEYMREDQTNLSTPVRIQISKPQDAISAFARSTYDKGGSLIRMLSQIMTLPVLKKTLTKYLKSYQYKVANSDQFLQVFTDQAAESGITYPDGSKIDFKILMDPWLDQKGFPLIKVVGNKKGRATVTQSRYFNPINQTENVQSPYKYKWDIPLHVLTSNSSESDWSKPPNYWLKRSQESVSIKVPDSPKSWLIVNPNQKFYYRVWYDKDQRKALADNILKLPAETRAQIIDDTFDLARNCYFKAADAFDNTEHLGRDTSHNTWSAALKHVLDVESFFILQDWYSSYRRYFSTQLNLVLSEIGYEFKPDDTISTQLLRKHAISSACWFGNRRCLEYSLEIYKNHKLKPDLNTINANILSSVLCTEVGRGGEGEFKFVSKEYERRRMSAIKEEKLSYAYAMTCSPKDIDIEWIFEDVIKGGIFFGNEDVGQVANYLAGNKYGAQLFWKYLNRFWHDVNPSLHKMSLIATIVRPWYTQDHINELHAFIKRRENLTRTEEDALIHLALKLDQNRKFHEENVHDLGIWFGSQDLQASSMQVSDLKITANHMIASPMETWSTSLHSFKERFYHSKRNRLS